MQRSSPSRLPLDEEAVVLLSCLFCGRRYTFPHPWTSWHFFYPRHHACVWMCVCVRAWSCSPTEDVKTGRAVSLGPRATLRRWFFLWKGPFRTPTELALVRSWHSVSSRSFGCKTPTPAQMTDFLTQLCRIAPSCAPSLLCCWARTLPTTRVADVVSSFGEFWWEVLPLSKILSNLPPLLPHLRRPLVS